MTAGVPPPSRLPGGPDRLVTPQRAASASERPPLRRDPTHGWLAGLCAGLADQTGVDPLLIRALACLVGISAGAGVVAYAAGWLVVPAKGATRAPIEQLVPAWARWPLPARCALVGLPGLAAVVPLGMLAPWSLGPLIVVGGVWWISLRRVRHGFRPRRTPPPSASPGRPQLRRIGVWTLCAALATGVGAGWTLGAAFVVPVALAVVALGLLVTRRWGRSRLLIVAGVLMCAAIMAPVVTTAIPLPTVVQRFERADDLPSTLALRGGATHVDLAGLTSDQDLTLHVDADSSLTSISLPGRLTTVVTYVTDPGTVVLPGHLITGQRAGDWQGSIHPDRGTLQLIVHARHATVVVSR